VIKVTNFQNWCVDNISPQSWTRICLKCVDAIRISGHTLEQLEVPNSDLEIDEDLFNELNEALEELYDLKVDKELLQLY